MCVFLNLLRRGAALEARLRLAEGYGECIYCGLERVRLTCFPDVGNLKFGSLGMTLLLRIASLALVKARDN